MDALREGWIAEDVIYEVMLKEGYPLDSTIEEIAGLEKNSMFQVTAPDGLQSFVICLDAALVATDVDKLQLSKDVVFVCRDVALTDTLAANLALQCRLKTI